MPTGKLKWFNVAKGFGFIIPDDGEADIYLSLKSVEAAKLPRLETGLILNYSVAESRGRKFADNLSIISSVSVETSRSKPNVGAGKSRWTRMKSSSATGACGRFDPRN